MMKFSSFCPGKQARNETSRVLRMASQEAEERFTKNGGMLLEKLIESWNGRCSPVRNFSANELQKATNNYDPINIIGGDDFTEWYKGSIEGRIVSIKKYCHLGESADDIDRAIKDIVMAAQLTAHNNILKLIGCCLETSIPIAVFDFAENRTLYSHIHNSTQTSPPQPLLLWKSRLRIATEIASAVEYLHTAFRTPIIHRNIISSIVYLDRQNVAKLSGFELSIALPEGETHVEDRIIGTIGYLAPEYIQTSLVSEKIDVYSFGVILIELLTGRKPIESVDQQNVSSLSFFRTHAISNEKNQGLDPTILEEVGRIDVQQQVRAVSELALKCTETDPEERPTMLDVARQLLQLKRLKRTIVDH